VPRPKRSSASFRVGGIAGSTSSGAASYSPPSPRGTCKRPPLVPAGSGPTSGG
jgi:hypothetical protein